MSSDTKPAMTYPTAEQYDRWKERADEFVMNVSQFMQSMIEAGLKKFDATVEPDETVQELRIQRNELKDKLDRARERIDTLEQQLYGTDAAAIAQHLEENPEADYSELVEQVRETAPKRVTRYLETYENAENVVRGVIAVSVDGTEVSVTDAARENVTAHLVERADCGDSEEV